MPDSEGDDTVRVSSSMPRATLAWLQANYPDATSDSQRLVMAISDARAYRRRLDIEVEPDAGSDGDD